MEGESTDNPKIEEAIPPQGETTIPEIPIEIAVEATEQPVDITEIDKKPAAKKKAGRPKGAADRKPRPARKKVVVQEEPIEEEKENELPRALPGSLAIPREATTDKAALMLELLQRQAMQRKNAKAQLWKSWFQ